MYLNMQNNAQGALPNLGHLGWCCFHYGTNFTCFIYFGLKIVYEVNANRVVNTVQATLHNATFDSFDTLCLPDTIWNGLGTESVTARQIWSSSTDFTFILYSPGERLCSLEEGTPGSGTYTRRGSIFASLAGCFMKKSENGMVKMKQIGSSWVGYVTCFDSWVGQESVWFSGNPEISDKSQLIEPADSLIQWMIDNFSVLFYSCQWSL